MTAAPVERRRRWRRQQRGGAAAGGERGGTGRDGASPASHRLHGPRPPAALPTGEGAEGGPQGAGCVSVGGGGSRGGRFRCFCFFFCLRLLFLFWLKSCFWSVTRGSCVCWGWGSGCRFAPGPCCKGKAGGARSRPGQEAAAGSGRRELLLRPALPAEPCWGISQLGIKS